MFHDMTFAECEAFLNELPICSLKYRLLDMLYGGTLKVKPTPKADA